MATIQPGSLRGTALFDFLRALPAHERDGWVDRHLEIESHPADVPNLPRGSVPYLPCGVDEILAAVCEIPIRSDDHFVDLGSGLGRVTILVHLLTGARASGIEIQEHLVRRAESTCAKLGLPISFVCANAANVDLHGSIFFLYSPFGGAILNEVLERLEQLAQQKRVIIAAVGLELAGHNWLERRATSHPALALYESVKLSNRC